MTALAKLSFEPSEGSNEPDVDCSYDEPSGTYINSRLNAPNVWVTDVQPCLVAEAAAIFERAGLRAAFRRLSTAHEKSTEKSCGEQVHCADGATALSAGTKMTKEQARSLAKGVVAKYDADGNGELDLEEFIAYSTRSPLPKRALTVAPSIKATAEPEGDATASPRKKPVMQDWQRPLTFPV